jgi:hypothetical protein
MRRAVAGNKAVGGARSRALHPAARPRRRHLTLAAQCAQTHKPTTPASSPSTTAHAARFRRADHRAGAGGETKPQPCCPSLLSRPSVAPPGAWGSAATPSRCSRAALTRLAASTTITTRIASVVRRFMAILLRVGGGGGGGCRTPWPGARLSRPQGAQRHDQEAHDRRSLPAQPPGIKRARARLHDRPRGVGGAGDRRHAETRRRRSNLPLLPLSLLDPPPPHNLTPRLTTPLHAPPPPKPKKQTSSSTTPPSARNPGGWGPSWTTAPARSS